MYRVKIEGLSIVAVEQMFEVIPTIPDLQEQVKEVNSNLYCDEEVHVLFTFASKAIIDTGTYISNSLYVPKDVTFNLSNVEFIGSSGNFASQVTVERSGTYMHLSSTNAAFAGLTASCIVTFV